MLFRTIRPLIVATKSPRRRSFLKELGLECTFLEEALGHSYVESSVGVLAKDDTEDRPQNLESPEEYVHRMCIQKAWEALVQLGFVTCDTPAIKNKEKKRLSYPMQCETIDTVFLQKKSQHTILTADTVVALGSEILGKPKDSEDAFSMLKRLAGRKHTVLTGVALADMDTGIIFSFIDTTLVHFAPWSENVLRAYVATNDSLDKAGAYGIQGVGIFLSDYIEGSWDTVAGLPVAKTLELLFHTSTIVNTITANTLTNDIHTTHK